MCELYAFCGHYIPVAGLYSVYITGKVSLHIQHYPSPAELQHNNREGEASINKEWQVAETHFIFAFFLEKGGGDFFGGGSRDQFNQGQSQLYLNLNFNLSSIEIGWLYFQPDQKCSEMKIKLRIFKTSKTLTNSTTAIYLF